MAQKNQGIHGRGVKTWTLADFGRTFPHVTGRALVVSETPDEALAYLQMQARDTKKDGLVIRGSGIRSLMNRDKEIAGNRAQKAQALRALGAYTVGQQILTQTGPSMSSPRTSVHPASVRPQGSFGTRMRALKTLVTGKEGGRSGGKKGGKGRGAVVTGPPGSGSGGDHVWAVAGSGEQQPPKSGGTSKLMMALIGLMVLIAILQLGLGSGALPRLNLWNKQPSTSSGQPLATEPGSSQVLPTAAAFGMTPSAEQPAAGQQTQGQSDNTHIQEQVVDSYLLDYRDVVLKALGNATDPDMGTVVQAVTLYQGNAEKAVAFIREHYGEPPSQYQQVLDLIKNGLGSLAGMASALQGDDWATAKSKAAEYEQVDGSIRQALAALGVTGLPSEPASMSGLLATWETNQAARLAQGQTAPPPDTSSQITIPDQPRQPSAAAPPASGGAPPASGGAPPTAPESVIQLATATPAAVAQAKDWKYGDRPLSYDEAYGEVMGWCGGCADGVDKASLVDTIMRWGIANNKQLQGYEAAHESQCHPPPPTSTPQPISTIASQALDELEEQWDEWVGNTPTPSYPSSQPTATTRPYIPPTATPRPAVSYPYSYNGYGRTENEAYNIVQQYLQGLVGTCISSAGSDKVNAILGWSRDYGRGGNLNGFEAQARLIWCIPTPAPTQTPMPKIYTYSELKIEMSRWNNKVYVHSRDSDGHCTFSGGIRGECPPFVSSGWIGQTTDNGGCRWESDICWWKGG